jgi:hypothetical protein
MRCNSFLIAMLLQRFTCRFYAIDKTGMLFEANDGIDAML